jgi:hypothetical protein
MAVQRAQPDPDGVITARLAGAADRHATREPLDVVTALVELGEIAGGCGDPARQAGGLDPRR